MKSKTIFYSIVVFTLLNITSVYADSPLTSIEFHKAYKNKILYKHIEKNKGVIDDKICNALLDSTLPIEMKIALINKLGWDINGKNNSSLFIEHLTYLYSYSSYQELLRKSNAETLICLAYLRALDNYFDVFDALHISKLAVMKSPHSFTINVISSLIQSHNALIYLNNWCEVYKVVEDVFQQKNLLNDMNDEGILLIKHYINPYEKYCD